MGPYDSKKIKKLLLHIAAKKFKLLLKFLLNGLHKTTLEILGTFEFPIFSDSVFFSKIPNLPLYHMWNPDTPITWEMIEERNRVK